MTLLTVATLGRIAGIVLLGIVLVASALSKVAALSDFQEHLASLGFPAGLTRPMAIGVIAWELVLGAMLLLEPRKRPLLAIALGTFLAFSAVNAVTLFGGADAAGAKSCGCFGALDAKVGVTTGMSLIRSLILAGCAGLVYWSLARAARANASTGNP